MRTRFFLIIALLGYCFTALLAQDSSIKYIMPYETDRLFPELISEYQAYYNNETAINKLTILDLQQEIKTLADQKQSKKVKFARWALEDDLEIEGKLETDLEFYLNVWLEIEEFYDQRKTSDFLSVYNPAICYTLFTFYDTLQVTANEITLREKTTSAWMEFPEPTDAEYIEDVRVITPGSSKWEKKKSDRPCNSSDPNDCLVWCLVEVPAEVEVLSRKLNIIECPVSYAKSEDGLRCEKKIAYRGELQFRDKEMSIYIEGLKREVEILDWEENNCND